MALKKGMFESYVKEREAPVISSKTNGEAKYSHNRVFDEPESLKKVLANQEDSVIKNQDDLNLTATTKSLSSFTQESTQATISSENLQQRNLSPPSASRESNPKYLRTERIESDDVNKKTQPVLNEKLNLRQIRDKHKTNLGQTYDYPETNLRQTRDEIETDLSQTQDKLDTQLKTKPETKSDNANLRQIWDKLETREILEKIEHLSDLQKNILLFIYKECQSVLDSKTAPLTIEYVGNACKSPISSVRKTIQRMMEKGILNRSEHKDGRGGWTRYELHKNIYQVINVLENTDKLETILRQVRKKLETELETQPKTNALSSSSSLKDIKTTTEPGEEWRFDITPYARFGFTSTQLKQIASLSVISPTDVEQSLIEFTYDLDNNALPPIKTTKINFLVGLLRSGHSYVSEGFKNEQETMISEMSRRADGKRKKFLDEKFKAWESCLSDEEKKEIERKLPTHLMVLYRTYGIGSVEVRDWLFNYYLQIRPQQ